MSKVAAVLRLNEIANPPPDPSLLPDFVRDIGVTINYKDYLPADERSALVKFQELANYVASAMIFLKSDAILERELTQDDIKFRLLGHFGTCPGLTLVYAHCNRLIVKNDLDMIYVVGPGHGAPAILADLWIEDSLDAFLPDYPRNKKGLKKLIRSFSWPGGFPSHVNAEVPGSIHEGGELGYSLAVAYGAVMDKPDLIATCVVGDGESESGPLAAAWNSHKYIDPAESGAVIPILHANGFKISERTIPGTNDDKELIALYSGYGYQVRIVEDLKNLNDDLAASMDWALAEIKKIQSAARSGKPIIKPRWPMIVLRTPKGFSGPKFLNGEPIEGSFHSHQVPLPDAKTNATQFKLLKEWLGSYGVDKLLTPEGAPIPEILSLVPKERTKRMGQVKETFNGYEPIVVPDWKPIAKESRSQYSAMKAVGEFLDDVLVKNPKSVRIFSPDELVSNKLDAVFNHTTRDFQWDPDTRAKGGRVTEILSEHCCQGWMQGYTLTGRVGVFPSYESFLGIIATMMVQYAKFMKMAMETKWRRDIGSLNYIETSTWTRQEHNGFSHQNPAFIGTVIKIKSEVARIYLPPDANCFLATVAHCLRSKNYINLMVGSKAPTPVYLSAEEAEAHCVAGASVWKFASTDDGLDPDVVLVGIGVEVTFEVIAAASLLKKKVPNLRIRVVNVSDLMILQPDGVHPHSLSDEGFASLFTEDQPVHFNYHGYPTELKGLLFGRPNLERVTIAGYDEEGTTTTPLSMMVLNRTDRWSVAVHAIQGAARCNPLVQVQSHLLISEFEHARHKHQVYVVEHGRDPDGLFDTPSF
ncbi:XFP N-terminal domain-containing protein [Lipomyces tetrasporus]|uniref:XFP N-terminal domain-containing protein n=1 Tax=Lipomyces tetrasporus TaxID=54092 RepID=A0AAD7QZ70_9ASCO|nr:XFP N-terminal domain-containing protein [Lipomyces tetrasporus]KAJ8102482.1 XFP N-terminal domain-containing protein [Lipomyces tetrasporus]